MPEILSRVNITNVHLKERNRHSREGIAQRHARVREPAGVDDDELGGLARFVDAVDNGAFMVGLEVVHCEAEALALGFGCGDDVGERCAAVNGGLARAEEVQVGAVDEEDVFRHGCVFPFSCS